MCVCVCVCVCVCACACACVCECECVCVCVLGRIIKKKDIIMERKNQPNKNWPHLPKTVEMVQICSVFFSSKW